MENEPAQPADAQQPAKGSRPPDAARDRSELPAVDEPSPADELAGAPLDPLDPLDPGAVPADDQVTIVRARPSAALGKPSPERDSSAGTLESHAADVPAKLPPAAPPGGGPAPKPEPVAYRNLPPPLLPVSAASVGPIPPRQAPVWGEPHRVPWEVAPSWGPTSLPIGANAAAGLSYVFWWISGLVVYFKERQNRFVRFHAMQSIVLTGVLTIFSVLAFVLAELCIDVSVATGQGIFDALGRGIALLAFIIVLSAWLTPMIAAWSGAYLRLPIVGDYAERYSTPPPQSSRPGAR